MRATFNRLWNETEGAILSSEVMMIGTILVIGVVVGLKSVRDSVVTELADTAQAFSNFNQSFSYSGVCGHASESGGGSFYDASDFCDTWQDYNRTQQSKCVNVATWAGGEW